MGCSFPLSSGDIRNTVIFRLCQMTVTWWRVVSLERKTSLDLRASVLHYSCCDEPQRPSSEEVCWFRVVVNVVQVVPGFSVCADPHRTCLPEGNSVISRGVIKGVRQKCLLLVTGQILLFQLSPHKFCHEIITIEIDLTGRHQKNQTQTSKNRDSVCWFECLQDKNSVYFLLIV